MREQSRTIYALAFAAALLIMAGMGAGYWLRGIGGSQTPPPSAPSGGGRILYYKNPMGLPDTSPVPKKDPMGMDYIPVYAGEGKNEPGIVRVSPARAQMLGVRTAKVELRQALARKVETTGVIQAEEGQLSAVTTKFDGVVDKLFVTSTGAPVRAGQALARVWIQTPETMMQSGPDIVTRQINLVIAMQDKNPAEIADAENILRQYGLPDSVIEDVKRTGRATHYVTVTAPRSGIVLEKSAVEGMHFSTGEPLFKIANLSNVWLIADVHEQDLGSVHVGDTVSAVLAAYPARHFTGKVDFIYHTLQAGTRTGQMRIVLPNDSGLLKPAMYANVSIDTRASSAKPVPVVPDSAILNSGTRQVVMVARGAGHFESRAVETGLRGDGYTQILNGVAPGEDVVVGANFLIDAESGLQAALQSFAPGDAPKEQRMEMKP